jgi:hypothetical protein
VGFDSAVGSTAVGAAWVFTRSAAGVWRQQEKLVGTTGSPLGRASQGSSVSLSGDGNTALVGGPEDNRGVGAAWVFTRSGVVWVQPGPKLVGTGAIGKASQGSSVALSGGGNTAIVGGLVDAGGFGAAWTYARFAFGTPGKANCYSNSLSVLTRQRCRGP